METEIVVARSWGKWEWGVTANGYGLSFGGDENVLELGDSCTIL